MASGPERAEAKRPLTFVEAALFQWLNPKAWTLALGTIAAFTTPGLSFTQYLSEIGLIALLSGVIPFACLMVWCLFGVMIARALDDERKRYMFQYALAGLLVASIAFLFV
jgi:threonine/homoserine/homoserine lactone efflux protein